MTLSDYRARAREALKGKYGYAILVTLIAGLVVGLPSLLSTFVQELSDKSTAGSSLAFVISIAGVLFVTYPFTVGLTRFFVKSISEKRDVNDLVFSYKSGLSRVVITMLLETIYVFLWSLLFIIPGIVKSYSYFMVEYLLAENPTLETSRIFEISKQAMDGYKMRAFLLGLSFIGYIILSVITFGIGFIFLSPYMDMTMAVFYEDVKQSAIERGIISEEELMYSEN